MTLSQWIGVVLLAFPFVVMTVFFTRELGWRAMVVIWSLVAVVVGVVLLGTYLLTGDLS